MNWTTILTEEARENCILRTDELARKRQLSVPIVRNALRRYELRGLVERVSTKIYINHLNQQFSPRDLVNILRPESYISLESALVERGVITQSPSVLTCVTPGYPQSFHSRSVSIIYRKISADLYWGSEEKATRYNKYRIAEPEKALLDWIYLSRQEGLPTPLDELQLQFIDRSKLIDYGERFPRTVRGITREILVREALSAQRADTYHLKPAR
jgi:predicted transcriptional regulator of viral defense system